MNIIAWALFGLIVGIVANSMDPDPASNNLPGTVLLGVGGAFIGGFLANFLFGVGINRFDMTSFCIAISGSLLLLFLGRAVRRV